MLPALYCALVRNCVFLVFDERTMLCNRNLLTSTVWAVWENIQPPSCCIHLAIVWSIQQDLEQFDIFHKALTLSELLILTIFCWSKCRHILFSIVFRRVFAINTVQYYILAACYLLYFIYSILFFLNIFIYFILYFLCYSCILSIILDVNILPLFSY